MEQVPVLDAILEGAWAHQVLEIVSLNYGTVTLPTSSPVSPLLVVDLLSYSPPRSTYSWAMQVCIPVAGRVASDLA